jgi:hydrogenase maturation protein HypF
MALAGMIDRLRQATGADTVTLTGGAFRNKLLLEQVLERLNPLDLRVLTHRQVPPGDGGLALGQAAIAAAALVS